MKIRHSLAMVLIVAALSLLFAPAAIADDCNACCYCASGFCVESTNFDEATAFYSVCTQEATTIAFEDKTIIIFYCELEDPCLLA